MSAIALITVPFDSGHRNRRMGSGPLHLLEAGVIERLESAGHRVRHVPIELESVFWTEIRAATVLQQRIALALRELDGERPIILSGNCNSSIGTVAGVDATDPGVIWLDAHPDLETPDSTLSGFYDGQALGTLTGRCWRQMTRQVDGFHAVPEDHVVLVGGRDASKGERELLSASEIVWVREQECSPKLDRLGDAFDRLRQLTTDVYLHVDLDVHSAEFFRANTYASAGGLSAAAVQHIVRLARERFDVVAASITAFDPAADATGDATAAALSLIDLLAQ